MFAILQVNIYTLERGLYNEDLAEMPLKWAASGCHMTSLVLSGMLSFIQ